MFFCGLSILCILIFSVDFQTHLMFHKRQWSISNSLGHVSFSERCLLFTAGWQNKTFFLAVGLYIPDFISFKILIEKIEEVMTVILCNFYLISFFSCWILTLDLSSYHCCLQYAEGKIFYNCSIHPMTAIFTLGEGCYHGLGVCHPHLRAAEGSRAGSWLSFLCPSCTASGLLG